MSPPTPKAVRVRTTDGWQDVAIQGAPGPPGRTPSCKAQSLIAFAAADTYYRGIFLNFTTIVFDDFGDSFAGGVWTCKQTGRYLIIGSFESLANTGYIGLAVGPKRHSTYVVKGADGNTWGTECPLIANYTAGNQLGVAGYHSGGGSGIFTFEAIRLDAPPVYLPKNAPTRVTPAEFAALTPVDGQEVYLRVDDANGIVWHLRYNVASASAYKWEYLGGPPLVAFAYDAQTVSSGPSFVDLPNGPSLTLPRAGDYDYGFGARCQQSAGVMAVNFGGVSPDYDQSLWWAGDQAVERTGRKTQPASGVIKCQYGNYGGAASFLRRNLWARPVRVS